MIRAQAVRVGGQLQMLFLEVRLQVRSPQFAFPLCLFLTQSFSFLDISSIYGGVKNISSCRPWLVKQKTCLGFILFIYSKQVITWWLKQAILFPI